MIGDGRYYDVSMMGRTVVTRSHAAGHPGRRFSPPPEEMEKQDWSGLDLIHDHLIDDLRDIDLAG